MVFSLAAFFVLFMYRHLTTLQLQRLYENFHKEAPADLLAHLGSLDACSNQVRTYMLEPVFICIAHASKVAVIIVQNVCAELVLLFFQYHIDTDLTIFFNFAFRCSSGFMSSEDQFRLWLCWDQRPWRGLWPYC